MEVYMRYMRLGVTSMLLAFSALVFAGMVNAAGQGDTKPPTSKVISPLNGAVIPAALWSYSIKGSASDGGGSGVQYVEVSTDDGFSWSRATDLSVDRSWRSWVCKWALSFSGNYTIKSRAVDNAGNQEAAGKGIKVRVTP